MFIFYIVMPFLTVSDRFHPYVPLHLVRWPVLTPSILSWAMLSSVATPIYTMATSPTSSAPLSLSAIAFIQPPSSLEFLYGDVDGNLYYGGGPYVGASSSLGGDSPKAVPISNYALAPGAFSSTHAPPRFYKLEFPLYDGAVDPLNWLNQCEHFFYGQRTLA